MTIQQLIDVLTPLAKLHPNMKVLWCGLSPILYIRKLIDITTKDSIVYISDGR